MLTDDYAVTMSDTTGQTPAQIPPEPNLYAVWIEADPAVITQIQADSNYYVLWIDDGADVEPPSNEFGQLRSFLSDAGVDGPTVNAAIGSVSGGRTRTEIVEELKAWLRTLNRAP